MEWSPSTTLSRHFSGNTSFLKERKKLRQNWFNQVNLLSFIHLFLIFQKTCTLHKIPSYIQSFFFQFLLLKVIEFPIQEPITFLGTSKLVRIFFMTKRRLSESMGRPSNFWVLRTMSTSQSGR